MHTCTILYSTHSSEPATFYFYFVLIFSPSFFNVRTTTLFGSRGKVTLLCAKREPLLPSQHFYIGPMWVQSGQNNGPHVGLLDHTHMGLSAGSILAPSQLPMWVQGRITPGFRWAPSGQNRQDPFWSQLLVLCGPYMGPVWAEIWVAGGIVHGFHVGPKSIAHVSLRQDLRWGPAG